MRAHRSNDRLARVIHDVLRAAAKRPATPLASLALALQWTIPAGAAELPVPRLADFVTRGNASAVISGNTLDVTQTTNTATLNWASFNISSDGVVNFHQPNELSTAINRIHQNDPSRIFGALTANGRVYLLNRNGVLFGEGAKVNVAGMVASSLDIWDEELGIAAAAAQGRAAFQLYDDGQGPLLSGNVEVERGATITTPNGGQVLMFAPRIVNEGTISTPGGQTLLAAGSPVYLVTSTDPNLRGFLVEVGVGGTVVNGNAGINSAVSDPTKYVGQIVAERGNVTLAGLAVNQEGRVSATTTTRENGSIRLQARDGGSLAAGSLQLTANHGGTLTLGQGSVNEVTLSNDSDDVTVDANKQPRSQIQLQGHEVLILEDSRVTATGGNIAVTALANPGNSSATIAPSAISGTLDDGSRIYVADGATLDVSGAEVELAMERNVVRAELRGDELADSPVQRDGALRGQAVFVDLRRSGTREDGTTWFGTPLGDVSGQISLTNRGVAERNLNGGTVSLESQGDVILAANSTIDLSGGSIRYLDGYINSTSLLGSDGRLYDIADADPNRVYIGTTTAYTVEHERWGVKETYAGFGGGGHFEQGYVEGKDAGALRMVTRQAILDGDVVANVTVGRYQREAATALAEGQIYRPYTQLPLGAQLTFGADPRDLDSVGGAVRFGSDLVLPTLTNADGSAFDPEDDRLPDSFEATTLRTDWFGENRIARAEIYSNDRVELSENIALQLPGQGELLIHAGQIDFAGQVRAPSGAIDLSARETETTTAEDVAFDLRSSAVLDVRGEWINDSPLVNLPAAQLAPLLIDGGEVTLGASQGSLHLAAGSVIDVSGGAWMQADGSLSAGAAGSINLSARRDPLLSPDEVMVDLGAQLLAYGLEDGGSLSISAPEVCVAAQGDCGTDTGNVLLLRPEDLLAGGFGSVSLRSNERGLTVAAGTNIELRQSNRQLTAAAMGAVTGTDVAQISSVVVLPDHLRAAADLSLRASIANLVTGPYTNDTFGTASGLTIGEGATIIADPGANISLQSNSTLIVDGTIAAPAGNISLRLDNSLSIGEVLSAQGIWLGEHARLDARGTTLLQPNEFGLRRGEVLDGGEVRIQADRGAVIANAGSQIDVSGASAVLDLSDPDAPVSSGVPTSIASDGGLISITASESVILGGQLNAHAGSGSSSAAGGRLQLTLDANQRGVTLPVEERRIVVTQEAIPVTVAPGTSLPDMFAQQARVAADDIEAGGFDSVTLTAHTTEAVEAGTRFIAPGAIEFDGDVDLSVGRQLVFDAARITGTGNASVAAPYVALGHSDAELQEVSTLIAPDSGTLRVSAGFLEVIGHSTIDGFENVRLLSEGDLRLRGVLQPGASAITGALQTSADLTLRADQVYASTLSDFEVAVENNPEGVLRVESTGQERATVLSAASHLTLSAAKIEQAGVLRAPFGTIELNADEVRLQAGSLTSTSAENAVIPFGAIQAGNDWVYSLDGSNTLVVGDTTAVPEKTVSLDGERVSIDAGAVIDVSGGGDLLAYEFVPGTTGTQDVLSAAHDPNQFAIVPGLNIQHAPYDPQESAGSSLSVGDSVHISAGVEGLPEGDYVLLPARYALLEGAYLVKAVEGHTDLQAGRVAQRLDGSTVVSGRRIVAGTPFADARTSGFAVRPASAVSEEARYETALASEFLVERAQNQGTALPRLPQDAGVLAITAGAQLDINGTLQASAVDDGRGAGVDISAQNLVISDSSTGGEGQVVVSAESLSRLGAESLLLGGRRSSTDEGTAIAVGSQNVTIDAGTSLSAPEIMLVATDTVSVQAQAELIASGAAPQTDTYLVEGDGAVLRLAAGEQAEIRRDNESGVRGTLLLDEGARLTATGGALALDSSLDTQSRATLSLAGGSLSLGASRINLGAAPDDTSGLTLDEAQLSGLDLDELVLVSRSTIDLYGDVVLDVNDVALDGAGLRGLAQSEGGSITAANSILLTNRADRTAADAADVSGVLQLNAGEIVVGEGVQRISGYQSVTLNASEQIRGEEQGGLSVAGDLTLVTPAVVAAAAADTKFSADGALLARSSGGVSGVPGQELGGTLSLLADSVDVATRLEAAAGSVSITATQDDVTLSSGAIIDVAGRERDFDGAMVAAAAGDVKLSAERGDVLARAGSLIDVSAAGSGEAGSVTINAVAGSVALAGTLAGAAQDAARSGRFDVDAANIGNFSALNTVLNTGGFFAEREFRRRGAGDLVVAASDNVRAQQVSLSADRGNVLVNGTIDARGANGGDVVLSARDAVHVNGSILASAQSADGDGGDVALRATTGSVVVDRNAIDVSGGSRVGTTGGDVDIRVHRSVALTLTDDDSSNDRLVLAADAIRGADQTTLEAFEVYTDADGLLTNGPNGRIITRTNTVANASNVLYAEAQDFMNSEADILAALGRSDDASFRLLPGIEIQTAGNLLLGRDNTTTGTNPGVVNWNLATWRFGAAAAPGVLTLRAGGNLTINGTISDGFALANGETTPNSTAYRLAPTPSDSWSYRLVAGADAGSADVMAVDNAVAAAGVGGNFTIAAGTGTGTGVNAVPYRMVRTGNGSIDVATAGDFILGNQNSVLYTAGVASTDAEGVPIGVPIGETLNFGLGQRLYPVDGGDISIDAQGDIEGAQSNQLVNDWLWRTGNPDGYATAWTVNFAQFRQNVGALGGGNVDVAAGGAIRNFSASIPSIGQQVGGVTAAQSRVNVIGGGNLDVRAGGNIEGGSYYIGLGSGRLEAGGDIAASRYTRSTPPPSLAIDLFPVLALGDGQWNVLARGSVGLEAIVNPTLLPQGTSQNTSGTNALALSAFSTYAEDSAVSIRAASGDVLLSNDTEKLSRWLGSPGGGTMNFTNRLERLEIYAPTLQAASLSGDLVLRGRMTLYPAADSHVLLFANDDVRDAGTFDLYQSDADPALLPNIAAPSADPGTLDSISNDLRNLHATMPVHAGDDAMARVVARTGDVDFESSIDALGRSQLYFATPVRVAAAGDIVDLPLIVQHDDAGDVSSIVAGGDIRYSAARSTSTGTLGDILPNTREIAVDGPGTLQLAAGGDVDLQTSKGISSRGNLINTNLPAKGADISVLAGLNGKQPQYDAMITHYLELGSGHETDLIGYVEARTGEDELTLEEAQERFEQFTDYREDLVAYVERVTGRDDLSQDQALTLFRGFERAEQRVLLERVLFSELRFSGSDAVDSKDFRRGFTALETLFPGANPDTEAGETNAYAGDIALYFSQIYTLDGGTISLLAPGGEINVGLAAPPASFGLSKQAAELGLVAQSTGDINALSYNDFQVNESRVFAADGGNILVWATEGDIDAGRGAKTAISAPPPTITFDPQTGAPIVTFPASLAGSGIQTLATSEGVKAGNVSLFAPRGVVNAGDAGIVAGNLTIAATAVLGADNIQVSGVAVGVPVDAGGLGASLAGVSAAASSASSAATTSVDSDRGQEEQQSSLASAALSWLEVFVVGLGEENCKQDDIDCLKRQKTPN